MPAYVCPLELLFLVAVKKFATCLLCRSSFIADTGGRQMATWRPDPTFYPSPRLATQAPPEKLAYVATLDPTQNVPT